MSGTAQAVTALIFDAAPAVQGAAQFDAAGQKIIAANDKVVNATSRTTEAQGNMERQLARLTRQIDPAAAAQAKLEAGQRLLERAFQRGRISAEEKARSLALLDTRFNSAAAAASRLAAANDNASASSDRLGIVTQGLASSMGSLGAALTSPTAAIAALVAASSAGVVQIARFGDEYTTTMNRLRAATGSVQAASAVYADLVALSQQTGASISESAGAFVRFSVAARAIGATNGEVIQLTRTIQQAGLISGASTQEAASGVLQLGQALASGKLQGDELRSILESMPTLAEALAAELGVSIGQLRTMGSEGQLTSDRVFQALLRAGEGINRQFNELTPTMGRAFSALGQAMVDFVGKLDQALGLSQRIAAAAQAAAGAVGRLSQGMGPATPEEQVAASDRRLRTMQDQLRQAEEALAEQRRQFLPRNGSADRLALAGRVADQDPQVQAQAQRIAALRTQLAEEQRIQEQAQLRLTAITEEGALARFNEQTTAEQRRQEAARAAATAAFNAARDALDKERKAREEHAARVAAIDAGLANGDTDAAGAARLRRIADGELAESLRERGRASGGAAAADRGVADAARAAADADRDRTALMREGETLTASVRTEAERYADTLANLNNLLSAGAITQDTYNRAVAAADPAIKAAQEASRRIEQDNTRTTDRITSFFGDAFARAFEGTGNGFRGLMESFKRAAISTFASIAAQAIIRPIVAPIVSGLGLGGLGGSSGGGLNLGSLFGGGTAQAATTGGGVGASDLGGLGTLRQAYNGLTSPGGLGSFFPGGAAVNTGFGGLDGLLNTSLVTPTLSSLTPTVGAAGTFLPAGVSGPVLPAALPIAEGGLSIAGSLGPLAAIGGGAYGIYSGIQKGGIGGGLGAAGGAVSTVTGLGMLGAAAGLLPALGALGPIGLGIGAALAIAGALMPGAKPSGQGQLSRVELESGERTTDGLGGSRFSQGNMNAASSAVNNIKALADEIEAKLQASGLVGGRAAGAAAVGVTNSTLYLDINGEKAQFANNEQGSKDLAAAAGRMVINSLIEGEKQNLSRIGQGGSDRLGILLGSGTPETLGQNLQWYDQVYKAFDDTGEAADKTAEAIKAVEAEFAPLIAKAQELGLSTDNIVKARAKDIESAKEAVAEAEAARLAELAGIRSTLQMRQAAANDTADHEARMLAGQVTRTQAWAEELRGLEQRLTALGSSTEDTAAQLETLTAIQSAEYWRNFATSMEALDRAVSGRILRAGGRTGAADRLDFEAAAAEQIKALAVSLADLGLTAEQAAAKIDQTQQAIQAERDARARAANEQIVALDQSVIGRILRATGRGAEADAADFEAAAALEVRNLARTLDDLGYSAEVVASKILETEQAIGLERIAMQKRIADEAASIAAAQLEQVMRAGQSIREYLNRLATDGGPGGVSREQALVAAQGQFTNDLAGARQNDQDALARITGTADRLLEAGRGMYGSTLAYQQLRAMIVTTLQGLEQTRTYDAAQGFATGGSFMATGQAGTDNLSLSNVRVTAGEMVNISRQDSMGAMAFELRALRQEVAELRREQVESIRQQTRVIAAVGEETTEQGAKTVQLLSAQVGATRLAGAA
jgi:tape measure domain-containing protein